jgi:cell division protein FtsA
LAGNSSQEISSPLFATAVGLVMNSIANDTVSAYRIELKDALTEAPRQVHVPVPEQKVEEVPNEVFEDEKVIPKETSGEKIKKSFFDKYVEKIKDFLDNAE